MVVVQGVVEVCVVVISVVVQGVVEACVVVEVRLSEQDVVVEAQLVYPETVWV